jgi:hypothetical protein
MTDCPGGRRAFVATNHENAHRKGRQLSRGPRRFTKNLCMLLCTGTICICLLRSVFTQTSDSTRTGAPAPAPQITVVTIPATPNPDRDLTAKGQDASGGAGGMRSQRPPQSPDLLAPFDPISPSHPPEAFAPPSLVPQPISSEVRKAGYQAQDVLPFPRELPDTEPDKLPSVNPGPGCGASMST